MTPEQIADCESVWNDIRTKCPEFTEACDIVGNYHAVREIVLGGSPSWAVTNAQFVPQPGKLVMDVGANAGIYSAYCAVKGADVVAYEPHPEIFRLLSEMVRHPAVQHLIQPINAAIWKFTGMLSYLGHKTINEDVTCFNGGVLSDGVNWTPADADRAAKIPCISFDDAIGKRKWDMVKMDIEGAECEVLRYASVEALRRIRFMFVEFHPWVTSEMYEATIQRMRDVFIFTGNDFHPDQKRWQSAHLLNPAWALMCWQKKNTGKSIPSTGTKCLSALSGKRSRTQLNRSGRLAIFLRASPAVFAALKSVPVMADC
jgi:FkbM family methyltransferase